MQARKGQGIEYSSHSYCTANQFSSAACQSFRFDTETFHVTSYTQTHTHTHKHTHTLVLGAIALTKKSQLFELT